MKALFGVSERRACRVLGHPRSTQRYKPSHADDEKALTEEVVELASQFGRYGYRRITTLLRQRGWHVNHKRVGRIWRREGLKVPTKQPKRGRLWFNDGSCVRLRLAWKDHTYQSSTQNINDSPRAAPAIPDATIRVTKPKTPRFRFHSSIPR